MVPNQRPVLVLPVQDQRLHPIFVRAGNDPEERGCLARAAAAGDECVLVDVARRQPEVAERAAVAGHLTDQERAGGGDLGRWRRQVERSRARADPELLSGQHLKGGLDAASVVLV